MKKLFLRTMLLLCALVGSITSSWAADVEIFNVACGGNAPTGWTMTGEDKGDYWLFTAGTTENVTTSAYDLSSYDTAKITAEVATFNSGSNPHAKIEISYDGGVTFTETTTQGDPTSKSYVALEYTLQNKSNNVVIRVSNSISSGKGLRFKNFKLIGTSTKTAAGLAYTTNKYITTYGSAFATPTLTNPHDLTISYTSSDETIATVDPASGAITILNKMGSTTITASTEGNATYTAGSASYTIHVYGHTGLTAADAFTVAEANHFISNGVYTTSTNYYVSGIISRIESSSVLSGGYLTYDISDDGTETAELNVYKGKNLNNVAFTAVSDIKLQDEVIVCGNLKYYSNYKTQIDQDNYIYSLLRKNDPELAAVAAAINMDTTTEQDATSLFTVTSDGVISYSSDDETVAKVENGKLKALKPGNATITINVAQTATYAAGSIDVDVIVASKPAVDPVGQGVGGFTKITSTEDLTDGDYLIVCESQNVAFNGGLTTLDATSNTIAITITNNKIESSDATKGAIFTYNATDKTLLSKSGKYIGRTTNSNGLDANTTKKTNTITFSTAGDAIITSSAGPTLQFNKTSGQTRFRYFTGTQEKVQLYKLDAASTFDVTIGEAGWRSLVSAQDIASLPSGLKAYIVTGEDATTATLTEVNRIVKNTPVLLNGAADTYTLTISSTALDAYEETNLMAISTETTGGGVYVLAKKAPNGVGFYKWNGGSLGAGRVYLPASAAAREFIGFNFNDDVTGVSEIEVHKKELEGIYDLQGRKVTNPTKGLYIINGKKVVIK